MGNFLIDFLDNLTGKTQILQLQTQLQNKQLALNDALQGITALTSELNKAKEQRDEANRQIQAHQKTIDQQNIQVTEDKLTIDTLKATLVASSDPPIPEPEFLDQSKPPYTPVMQYTETNGRINVAEIKDARDIFTLSLFQKQKSITTNWPNLPKIQRLMQIWEWTIDPNIKYSADYGDNWQPGMLTWYRKAGDCECKTIFFVEACWAAGIPADEVFLATGPTAFGYHVFPVVLLSSNDIAEVGSAMAGKSTGWYIFEATLNFLPNAPYALKNSRYWIDAGLSNWKFAGIVKPKFYDAFNAQTQVAAGACREIENSLEKVQAINDFWKKM